MRPDFGPLNSGSRRHFSRTQRFSRTHRKTTVFRTAPAPSEKRQPAVSETCSLCNGPFRPRFVASDQQFLRRVSIRRPLGGHSYIRSPAAWPIGVKSSGASGLDRQVEPGGSSETCHGSSRQQRIVCGTSLFLPLPAALFPLLVRNEKNDRGGSSAALLSSQLWLTTFGVAGAFNPERPGSRESDDGCQQSRNWRIN
jgi:hypothetical protein